MADFFPSAEAINIKSFKDSFASTGRLDAEYYQPKYEDFERAVVSYPAGHTAIAAEFDLLKETSQRLKGAYNYIEISDVNVSDGTARFNRLEVGELPANAKQEVQRGDLLISKVRPNRGAVAIIDFDNTDLIVSGAFTVLREKAGSSFSKETLKVLLRMQMYREWLLKFNIGTQYPVIRDDDILNLPIPCIDVKTQTKIAALVQQSYAHKSENERLLEAAKRAVEIAIEQDEAAGLAYLAAQTH
jgi:type I restriction enzyme S subunit